MNLSSMKYIEMRKHQNNDFKRCQDFEDMGKIRCLCQNGSRHKKKPEQAREEKSRLCHDSKSWPFHPSDP